MRQRIWLFVLLVFFSSSVYAEPQRCNIEVDGDEQSYVWFYSEENGLNYSIAKIEEDKLGIERGEDANKLSICKWFNKHEDLLTGGVKDSCQLANDLADVCNSLTIPYVGTVIKVCARVVSVSVSSLEKICS